VEEILEEQPKSEEGSETAELLAEAQNLWKEKPYWGLSDQAIRELDEKARRRAVSTREQMDAAWKEVMFKKGNVGKTQRSV
jgi:hypothetical protein